MGQYIVEQRVFIVRKYYKTHSYAEVQRLLRLQFPGRDPPDKKNIWRNVKKYEDHGTSLNRNLNNSVRKRTGRSEINIDAVHDELINNPVKATCRVNNTNLPNLVFKT